MLCVDENLFFWIDICVIKVNKYYYYIIIIIVLVDVVGKVCKVFV